MVFINVSLEIGKMNCEFLFCAKKREAQKSQAKKEGWDSIFKSLRVQY